MLIPVEGLIFFCCFTRQGKWRSYLRQLLDGVFSNWIQSMEFTLKKATRFVFLYLKNGRKKDYWYVIVNLCPDPLTAILIWCSLLRLLRYWMITFSNSELSETSHGWIFRLIIQRPFRQFSLLPMWIFVSFTICTSNVLYLVQNICDVP